MAPNLPWSRTLSGALIAAAMAAALLLIIAEFTTLYVVATTAGDHPVTSVSTGSHDAYALIPIALVVLALGYAAALRGSRPALLALGALGVATLLIALIGDLPDAQATGVVGNAGTHFQSAAAKPQAGLYLETMAAVLLIISCGCGLLLAAPGAWRPRPRTTRPPAAEGPRAADGQGAADVKARS